MNADRFGYYSSGSYKTYSKLEAIERGGVQWHFNDDVFSALDWTTEPQISLQELYKERAKQIRSKYDYVVLFYSGGSDSHNVLKSWIAADCKIDEIAVFWDYDTTGDRNSYMNSEIAYVVLPHLHSLLKSGHKFKIRFLNTNELNYEPFKHDLQYEYLINTFFSINNLGRSFLRDYVDDWKNMINQGKEVCFVWGKEKPIINYENGHYFFQFYDHIDDCVNPYAQMMHVKGWRDELFMWSPDAPEICLKAAHVLKNFLMSNDDPRNYVKNPTNFGYNDRLQSYMSISTYKKLIYPNWDIRTFQNGKPRVFLKLPNVNIEKARLYQHDMGIFSPRDKPFITGNKHEKDRYISMIDSLFKKIGAKTEMPTYFSKKYWLS